MPFSALTESTTALWSFLVTPLGFEEVAPKTEIFAKYEGFDAHANAVSALRVEVLEGK